MDFHIELLQAENIRSARCWRVVLSKLLAARKANFLSLLVLAKKSQSSHARECPQRPFVTLSMEKEKQLRERTAKLGVTLKMKDDPVNTFFYYRGTVDGKEYKSIAAYKKIQKMKQ